MSRLRKGLLGLLLSFGLTGWFAASGYAYLGQYSYDDRDPNLTYDSSGNTCASSAKTVSSTGTAWGSLELRFSFGCQTAWAKFTCRTPPPRVAGCYDYNLRIQRDVPDGATIDHHIGDVTHVGQSTYWRELNDAGSFRSKACWWYDAIWPPVYCTGDY